MISSQSLLPNFLTFVIDRSHSVTGNATEPHCCCSVTVLSSLLCLPPNFFWWMITEKRTWKNELIKNMWEYGVENWCSEVREMSFEEHTDSFKNE